MLQTGEPKPLIGPRHVDMSALPLREGVVGLYLPLAGLLNHAEMADKTLQSAQRVHDVVTKGVTHVDAQHNFFCFGIDRERAYFRFGELEYRRAIHRPPPMVEQADDCRGMA